MPAKIQSKAFHQAMLLSERIRIIGLLCAVSALIIVSLVRSSIAGSELEAKLLIKLIFIALSVIAYEFVMLIFVNRRIRLKQNLSAWILVLNLIIESLIPSLVILLLTSSQYIGPYKALVAPALSVYFFFIILSTLRLNPRLSWLTGLFSCAGYLVVILYTHEKYPNPDPTQSIFPLQFYVTNGVFILMGGFIAGAVAGQIRKYVFAALQEAETRRQKEQMEHDLNIARSIQQGLLPSQFPQIEGFDIAGWNEPTDETGGDYYDWQQLPDGRLAISLADVTGHGIGPALVTAICRAYSRASIPAREDLGIIIDRINELLVDDLRAERFVTFVVGLLDPIKSNIQLLSAGQGPLLLYTASDNKVQSFNAHDIPLGLAPNIGYGPPQEIKLDPGDMLVLITDGFFEWANSEGEQFGLKRLERTIHILKDFPADQIISGLHSAVLEFAGGTPQNDDLTIVIIKRKTDSKAESIIES